MRTAFGTIGQAVILLVLASVIGLGANAWRGRNKVDVSRPYIVSAEPDRPPPTTGAGASGTTTATGTASTTQTASGFQEISLADAYALYNDPGTQVGQYVFVDARNDEHYQGGHIPGAVQCDHWRLADYLGPALPRIIPAEKVVVYCNGGSCEDSMYVCHDLEQSMIPRAKIWLFRGGWEEWSKANYPTATGPQ